jgi:hypothetical protein
VVRLTVGGIAGSLFLAALIVLFVASIGRIIAKYRDQRKVDVVALVGMAVVFLVLICVCLTLLGPTIGETLDLIALPD